MVRSACSAVLVSTLMAFGGGTPAFATAIARSDSVAGPSTVTVKELDVSGVRADALADLPATAPAPDEASAADAPLAALLGGPRVYDEAPANVAFPYVTLGEQRVSDFSTDGDAGVEHQLTLHAWSRQGGHRQAHLVAGALLQALDDAPLALADHRLVNFRFAVADVRREADGRTYHALVRFRAVTEPQ